MTPSRSTLLLLSCMLLVAASGRAAAECTSLGFTLASGSPISPGQYPRRAVAADFNLDGKPDMAALKSYYTGTAGVYIMLGDGAGGLTNVTGSPFDVNSSGPNELVVADFNRDGIPDIAVGNLVNPTGDITLLIGSGTGTFSAASGSPFSAGGVPTALRAADLDTDGDIDLAATTQSGLVIMLNNGSGTLTKTAASPYAAGTDPSEIGAADFDRDGDIDLAVSNYLQGANNIRLFLNNGAGSMSLASGSPFTHGTYAKILAAGDLNLDGRADLVVHDNYALNNTLTILLGTTTASRIW